MYLHAIRMTFEKQKTLITIREVNNRKQHLWANFFFQWFGFKHHFYPLLTSRHLRTKNAIETIYEIWNWFRFEYENGNVFNVHFANSILSVEYTMKETKTNYFSSAAGRTKTPVEMLHESIIVKCTQEQNWHVWCEKENIQSNEIRNKIKGKEKESQREREKGREREAVSEWMR